jgi:tripartite-type tricarboxylate transporter receptor subunit TctC
MQGLSIGVRSRAHLVIGVIALVIVSVLWRSAFADVFPDKPIKFIVGFGVGGPTDIVARVLADQLSGILGKRILVENLTGASGNMATQAVATAGADGHTYLIGATPLAVNQSLFPDFPVKFGKDLVGVAPIGATSNVLVVHPSLNIKSMAEFVRLARERPDFITYATLGQGSSSHLAGVAFDMLAGTRMVPAAYRGGGDAAKDLIGGHIHAWFATIPSVLEAVRAGQLVAIATTGPERATWLPDVPTIAETGFPGFDVRLWVGVFSPAGVPGDRMRAIEEAIARSMASQEMQKILDNQGIAPFAMNRVQFDTFVSREIDRWKNIVGALKK